MSAASTIPAPNEGDWPAGTEVVRHVPGVPALTGRVEFVDDGWVHWRDSDGYPHASRPDVLRRLV